MTPQPETIPAKRLSLSEMLAQRHEEAMASATRARTAPQGLETERARSGDMLFRLQTYQQEDEPFDLFISRTLDTTDRLRAHWPMRSGYVGAVADGK